MKKIPYKTLLKVDNVIKKYSLFTDGMATVAYSGGKDSLFLCRCLIELGFEVMPIILDIGYKNEWKTAIDNLSFVGLNTRLIDSDSSSDIIIKSKVNQFFSDIVDINSGKYQNVSPCTPCYNAKMTLLIDFANHHDIDLIAMGHHGTDAIASVLKSYFMYYDRWREEHTTYNPENFMRIIQQHKPLFQMDACNFKASSFYQDLKEQINNQNVGTDEAVLQETESSLRICRPLYEVTEDEILTYYRGETISFNCTECFFRNLRNENYLTPREMVQYTLLRGANPAVLALLMELNYLSLDHFGRLIYRARNNRDKILGTSYKTNNINIKKI